MRIFGGFKKVPRKLPTGRPTLARYLFFVARVGTHEPRPPFFQFPEDPKGIAVYIPSLAHRASTFAFVARSISIIAGQGRSKPSAFHLRVASMPIFEP